MKWRGERWGEDQWFCLLDTLGPVKLLTSEKDRKSNPPNSLHLHVKQTSLIVQTINPNQRQRWRCPRTPIPLRTLPLLHISLTYRILLLIIHRRKFDQILSNGDDVFFPQISWCETNVDIAAGNADLIPELGVGVAGVGHSDLPGKRDQFVGGGDGDGTCVATGSWLEWVVFWVVVFHIGRHFDSVDIVHNGPAGKL